jgi:prevent-host-death family protein
MFSTISTVEIKAHLSQWLSRVAFNNERLVVLRRGKPVAALVSVDDLRRLEALDAEEQNEKADSHPIMSVFGAWADRDDLDDLVAEIYAERERSVGREISL